MGQNGIFVIVFQVAVGRKPRLVGQPEIVSRGTPMPRHPANFLKGLVRIVNSQLESTPLGKGSRKFDRLKDLLTSRLQDYLEKQTQKKPLVEAIIVEI